MTVDIAFWSGMITGFIIGAFAVFMFLTWVFMEKIKRLTKSKDIHEARTKMNNNGGC